MKKPDGQDGFPGRYLRALRLHLGARGQPGRGPAGRLGLRARALGIETLGLARIHDGALAALAFRANGDSARHGLALRAASFFAEALVPIEATHRTATEARAEHGRLVRSIGRGALSLAGAKRRLAREAERRRVAEEALRASDRRHRGLLLRAKAMQEELRQLSRSLLVSHEEERRRISRELHDALGQSLTAINVDLASLKVASAAGAKGFRGTVSRTQRLVQKSMRTVHHFARHLRPTLLDDMGLVPALVGFAKEFGRRNGLAVEVTSPGLPAELDGDSRTALFRVAQEALVNVERHGERVRHVRITIRRTAEGLRLEIWNDGKPFDVARTLRSRSRRFGLLCMRERMDMVGGSFEIQSSREIGTIVRAEVPLREPARA